MRILVVKTSSLGDLIHTLPALTDAQHQLKELTVDWVAEQAFAEIPTWHDSVDQVHCVAMRQWRKQWWSHRTQIKQVLTQLRAQRYDAVIDAQGLWKSALLTRLAHGPSHGYAKGCVREPVSWLYQQRHQVAWGQHAVTRIRQLFAKVLGYPCALTPPDYAIRRHFAVPQPSGDMITLVHGTSWENKLWPLAYWQQLTQLLLEQGFSVQLLQGSDTELARAQAIAADHDKVTIVPRGNLSAIAQALVTSRACVAVDTGIGHLACALDVPCISLYGPTDAHRTGTLGLHQVHLSSQLDCSPCLKKHCQHPDRHHQPTPPCFRELTPDVVVDQLIEL
jgi:heptosyltransferase-1